MYTTMLVVPWPATIDADCGTVHVYETAPGTGSMLYSRFGAFLHTVVVPVIAPGVGTAPVMSKQDAALLPHALFAVTHRFPDVKPAKNDTVTEVVPCPAVTDAFGGAVHV
jgi:hypothetical protein